MFYVCLSWNSVHCVYIGGGIVCSMCVCVSWNSVHCVYIGRGIVCSMCVCHGIVSTVFILVEE